MYDLFRCIKPLYFPLDSEGLIWFEVSQHFLSLKRKSHQTLLSGRDPSVWGSLIWTAKTNLRAVSLWRAWYTLKWLCCCSTSILYCLIKSSCVLQGHVVVEVFVIEQNKLCYQLVTDYKHHEKTSWFPSENPVCKAVSQKEKIRDTPTQNTRHLKNQMTQKDFLRLKVTLNVSKTPVFPVGPPGKLPLFVQQL